MKSEAISEPNQEASGEYTPKRDALLLDVLITLSKRRRFILWSTLGAVFVAAIVAFIIPNEYTADTLILPPSQSSPSSSMLLSQLAGSTALASVAGANLGIRNPGDMYVSLFRSRTVEDFVIERFKLAERYRENKLSDARREFEEHSTVVFGVKDGLIRISVTDHDPKVAADIANGYVAEFSKRSDNLAISEASQRRLFFQQQLLEANQNLAAAEEAMKQTERSTGVLQVDSQAKALIESAAVLRAQIGMKEVELQGMRTYATEGNPQMVEGEQQLAALKSQLAKLAGSDQNSGSDIMLPKGNIPEAGLEYLRKLRDVKYYETITELIARQFEAAKLDEARQGAIVQVADPAVPPDKKSSPHRGVIIVLVTLIGFSISVVWALMTERWKQSRLDLMKRHEEISGFALRNRTPA
jgi:tyrosine-protein kinase Etk/Wzc